MKAMKKVMILLMLFISNTTFAQSTSSYVEKYKDAAVSQMNQHGIPASIILAVAMHESGFGNSKIARNLNNHFGIKGKNYNPNIRSAYKSYDSVEDSYADFISILQRKSQFSYIFDKFTPYDYRSWALAIQRGGYASSRTWASQVIGIIKKFKLYEYDNRPSDYKELLAANTVEKSSSVSTPASKPATVHRVKQGDTLIEIAKRYHTTVKAIQRKNGLSGSHLKLGQKLKI